MTRNRIVPQETMVGETAKAATRVARADCEEVVDGVVVDFRHPDLPPGEWEARSWWWVWSNSKLHSGFLFPSEAAAGDICEMRKVKGIGDNFPVLLAEHGDRLTVVSVVDRVIEGRNFDHLHDRVVKEASLELTKPDGTQLHPIQPMLFFGVTQFRDAGERDAYDRLAERILRPLGYPDPLRHEDTVDPVTKQLRPETGAMSERALWAISDAERTIAKLHSRLSEEDRLAVHRLISSVALAGFYQAKSEVRRAEETAVKVAEALVEGPRTLTNWDRVSVAEALAAQHPDWKRNAIATGVIKQLELNEDKRSSILRMLRNRKIGPEPA